MNLVYVVYACGLITYGVILLGRTFAGFRKPKLPVAPTFDPDPTPQSVVIRRSDMPTQAVSVVPADADDDWASYIPPIRMPE
jgi:hypothetical protein